MNSTKVGNHYVEEGKCTYHICARCIAFFGDGEYKFLGHIGCVMPNITPDIESLFKEWSVETADGETATFKRCFRCFINNQECVAVPDALREEFDAIQGLLKQLRRGYSVVLGPNPDYVAPPPGQTTTVPARITVERVLSEDEIEMKAFKLSKICKDLAKRLAREFIPHSSHLLLHNGALRADDEPCSDVRPGGRKRDNKTVAVKHEASKRSYEESVAAAMQKGADSVDSPRKKAKGGKVIFNATLEIERKKQDLALQLSNLEKERASAVKNKKGGITKQINKLQKEYDALSSSQSS